MSTGKNKLILFCGPSGSGKSTAVKHLLSTISELAFSVSATTREPREGEKNGIEYYFITEEDFQSKIEEDKFIEWEEVYSGTRYGTLKEEVYRIWDEGKHVVFDIDVLGGLRIKKLFPENSLAILMSPPSIEVLRQRLIDRKTETAETLERRVTKAEFELGHAALFDKVIVNDSLANALLEAEQTVREFISK